MTCRTRSSTSMSRPCFLRAREQLPFPFVFQPISLNGSRSTKRAGVPYQTLMKSVLELLWLGWNVVGHQMHVGHSEADRPTQHRRLVRVKETTAHHHFQSFSDQEHRISPLGQIPPVVGRRANPSSCLSARPSRRAL